MSACLDERLDGMRQYAYETCDGHAYFCKTNGHHVLEEIFTRLRDELEHCGDVDALRRLSDSFGITDSTYAFLTAFHYGGGIQVGMTAADYLMGLGDAYSLTVENLDCPCSDELFWEHCVVAPAKQSGELKI